MKVVRPGIDLVPRLELPHARPYTHHHARHIVPEDERHLVRQQELELTISDLGVERVDARCMDLHQHLMVAQGGSRNIGRPEYALFGIAIQNKRFHGVSFAARDCMAAQQCHADWRGSTKNAVHP